MNKFFGDKQQAEASGNGFVAQSQGNMTVHVGVSYQDVKEICSELHEKNFPVLREEARKSSIEAINSFADVFFKRIEKIEDANKVQEKLKSPDVQAAINSSIMHVGRMTNKSHAELLTELLAEKISGNNEDNDYLLNEAIEVTASIDLNSIRFAAFSFAISNLSPTFEGNVSDEEKQQVFKKYFNERLLALIGDENKPIDPYYLSYKGVLAGAAGITKYRVSILDRIKSTTGLSLEGFKSETVIQQADVFQSNFPKLVSVIESFKLQSIDDIDSKPLSRLGIVIAQAYFRKIGAIQ